MKRTCKICKTEREYNYLCLNTQGFSTYTDENNGIWKGKVCYPCYKAEVKKQSGDIPLSKVVCPVCNKLFMQRSGNHIWCDEVCYEKRKQLERL